MAVFGRLDVLYPDGHTASHQLEGEGLTVGSSTSDAIRIDDGTVAPSHFRLDVVSDAVSITDLGSDSGTFVAGRRLQSEVPRQMRAVENIRVGALRLTYYQRSDSPTVAMPALAEQTRPAAIEFRARLEHGEYTVFPASSATVSMDVTNRGRHDARFRVEASGLPDDWVQPGKVVFQLPAAESTQIQFHIRPARRSDMAPGDYPLTVTVTRLGDVEQIQQLVALVKLGGYSGLSLAVAPAVCHDDEPFSLFLLNQGNQPLELALALRDPQDRLAKELTQDQVELPPGGRRRISGKVKARRRSLIGKPVEIPFALVAQSQDPSVYIVAAPARLCVQPRWSYRAAVLAVAAVIAILLVAAAVFVQPPEPEIISFGLSHSQVARGTPVRLDWTAANAQQYVIEVDRVRVAELSGDAQTFMLDTAEYIDPVEIALIALQGNITDIDTRALDVYQPVIVSRFEADKSVMLRRVTESLIVRWEATGAVSVEITRPLAFETVRESAATAMRGEIVVRGAPKADFELKLKAEDEIGTVVERNITVSVKEPECVPLHDTLLYAGPDEGFQQIRLAVENVPVLVRGTVADGDWLQVELASGRTGWGIRSNFECRGFETSALAVIDDLPQLPTATDSPTAAPIATSTPTSALAATVTASGTETAAAET